MGNYYEGKLIFGLKRNLPDELLHDLSVLASERSCDRDIKPLLQHRELKESKWMNHYRALYPTYTLEFFEGMWFLTASFCMKGIGFKEGSFSAGSTENRASNTPCVPVVAE